MIKTGEKGKATIYEIKYSEDINGNAQKTYRELLDDKTLLYSENGLKIPKNDED